MHSGRFVVFWLIFSNFYLFSYFSWFFSMVASCSLYKSFRFCEWISLISFLKGMRRIQRALKYSSSLSYCRKYLITQGRFCLLMKLFPSCNLMTFSLFYNLWKLIVDWVTFSLNSFFFWRCHLLYFFWFSRFSSFLL